jgi:hypothetical protein
MKINRRKFIGHGLSSVLTLSTLPISKFLNVSAMASEKKLGHLVSDPHFFFHLIIPGGLDATYLWDARPLEMTQKGLIQNYLGIEPWQWTDLKGRNTLASPLVKPLLPYQKYFTILNGVHMNVGFDGHEQNTNFLLTGNPFGGNGFMPYFNMDNIGHGKSELDYLEIGRSLAEVTNSQNAITVNPETINTLSSHFNKFPAMSDQSVRNFIDQGFDRAKELGGFFGDGAALLKNGFHLSPRLMKKIESISFPGGNADPLASALYMVNEFFSQNLVKSAEIILDKWDPTLDTHDSNGAKKQPQYFQTVINEIIMTLDFLRNTAYDQKRSLMDVTTFLISTEFGRTMRQTTRPINNTGTDHNPLTNFLLLGGKGIATGQTLGGSDFESSDEINFLSKAHLSKDQTKIKIMGRPYNFDTGLPLYDYKPESYKTTDYLSCHNVINTLFAQFNIDKNLWRRLNNSSGPYFQTLDHLLKI